MFRILIKMDEEKVQQEQKYDLEEIYRILEELFNQKLDLLKLKSESGTLLYGDRGRDCDFSYFGLTIKELKNEEWFLDNADAWIFYEDEIESETDLLLHYANRASHIYDN